MSTNTCIWQPVYINTILKCRPEWYLVSLISLISLNRLINTSNQPPKCCQDFECFGLFFPVLSKPWRMTEKCVLLLRTGIRLVMQKIYFGFSRKFLNVDELTGYFLLLPFFFFHQILYHWRECVENSWLYILRSLFNVQIVLILRNRHLCTMYL